MSEIKLNLLDSHSLLVGTVHGSTGDRLVAALSAEPETIEELEAAFQRFEKDGTIFGVTPCRSERCAIDNRPYDAGILVIDLAARMVACESTYSLPLRYGTVEYHDGVQCTRFPLRYRLSDDWLILRSIEEYEARCKDQLKKRAAETPLDTRAILYGEPLLAFILENVRLLNVEYASDVKYASDVRYASACRDSANAQLTMAPDIVCRDTLKEPLPSDLEIIERIPADIDRRNLLLDAVIDIHRRWLMTPREDLKGFSPREVLFAKRELIDLDLDSRSNQWSYFLEEPPCLSQDSYAYRFAGFGTHEWVMYYDLVRFLIWRALDLLNLNLSCTAVFSLGSGNTIGSRNISTVSNDQSIAQPERKADLSFTPSFSLGSGDARELETVSTVSNERIALLEQLKNKWLSEPRDGYIPAEVIDNERRRRPEAMTGRSMVIDENCPLCKMTGDASEAGLEITFCHFDGSHMEDEFAFSWFATLEEFEQEQRLCEQWARKRELERKQFDETHQHSDDFDVPF